MDLIVTPDIKTAGAISYWRLAGPIDLVALASAWRAAGLVADELPEAPSDKVGLSRAMSALETATRRATRIQGGDFAGGWTLDDYDTSSGRLAVYPILRVKRSDDDGARVGGLVVEVEPGREFANGVPGEPIEMDLRRAYKRLRGELAPADVSAWLIRLADKIQAIGLRDRGGIYFIPRDKVDYWERVTGVVASVSNGAHRVFRIPALQTKEAVEAILDSVETEANETIASFEADLVKSGDDALGARALRTRQSQAKDLADKIGKYEGLLSVKLDKLREHLETVQADLVAAEFALEHQQAQGVG